MSRLKDITSTERLLDIIRNKKNDISIGSVDTSKIDPLKKRFKFKSPKIAPVRKSVNIGIDIGHKYLRLVKMAKLADNHWEMIAYKSVPCTHDRKSSEFINFLKSEINEFCGVHKNANLWAIMSAARVNVRHIHIPKVAKKRIYNAVYWTIKKETPFDEKDTIFDFEIQGEVIEQGVSKWLTMLYTAPKDEVDELKGLFSQMSLPLTGISIIPFAIQNIFKSGWIPLDDATGTVAGLFIGNDFSRIDIYTKGKLIMTRGIKAGINSMVEALMEQLMEIKHETSETAGKKKQINAGQARKILLSLNSEYPQLTEQDVGFELKEEEKFKIILPALERIVRQAERTFEHFKVNLNYDRVDKIYISSAMDISKRFIEYIGDQLAIKSDLPDPLTMKLPFTAKSMEQLSISERIALTPALGVALSDDAYTPNLLFRFKDKERATNIGRANRVIIAVLIVAIFLSSGFYLYQIREDRKKETQIAGLEKLAQDIPRVDQDVVSQAAEIAAKREQIYREYSDRYLGMAVVSELSLLTPANIRLINLRAKVGTVPSGRGSTKELKKETAKEELKHVVIEGIVFGDRRTLESSLGGYVMKLEASPIFRQISVQKNSIEPFKKTEVLYFVVDMQIG